MFVNGIDREDFVCQRYTEDFPYKLNKILGGHIGIAEIASISGHHLYNYDAKTKHVKLV